MNSLVRMVGVAAGLALAVVPARGQATPPSADEAAVRLLLVEFDGGWRIVSKIYTSERR